MKKPFGLTIEVESSIINDERNNDSFNKPSPKSSTISTYRDEGLSIGRDYMRMEGVTICPKLSFSSLNDFQIERTLGRGVSSVVKLARAKQSSPSRGYYALKIFHLFKEANRNVPKRHNSKAKHHTSMLTQEVKTLSKIQNESIVEFIGAFYNPKDDNVTMVLEYMDYGSLHDYIFSTLKGNDNIERLDERALSSIAYQTLSGLAYLHGERILHRDIKPQNILLNSKGEVKISDLGIASSKNYEISESVSSKGSMSNDNEQSRLNHTVIGTSWYMSPERVLDKTYGCPSDLWSFGLVILECAAGGWNPMRDGEFIDNDDNHDHELDHSKNHKVTSIIELAMILEDFSIDSTFDMLRRTPMKNSLPWIDWKKEIEQKNGWVELIIASLQKVPGEYFKNEFAFLLLQRMYAYFQYLPQKSASLHIYC